MINAKATRVGVCTSTNARCREITLKEQSKLTNGSYLNVSMFMKAGVNMELSSAALTSRSQAAVEQKNEKEQTGSVKLKVFLKQTDSFRCFFFRKKVQRRAFEVRMSENN